MAGWKTESSEIVYETKWFKIHRDEVRNHNGKLLTYSYLELQHPSVSVVAVNDEGKILLQKNYRYTIRQTVWGLPAGHSDGEEALAAAKRELIEETGLASSDWVKLGKLYSAAGVANVQYILFLARDVYRAEGERDEDEQITDQTFFTLEEIETMAREGQLEASGVLAALYLAKLHGLTKEGK